MKIGTHLRVGRHGSSGGLKDKIRNKNCRFVGRHIKKQLQPLGSCGFSPFPRAIEPERSSQSNPSVADKLTKIALKMQQK